MTVDGLLLIMILKQFDTQFFFWGDRDYVNGSHIAYGLLDAVSSWKLGPIKSLLISFYNTLRTQGRFLLYQEKQEAVETKSELCAIVTLKTVRGIFTVGLQKDNRIITKRFPGDEDVLLNGHTMKQKFQSATIENFDTSRTLTVISSLNKKVLLELLPTEEYGAWRFAKFYLSGELSTLLMARSISLSIKNNIGDIMTLSSIKINGNEIGEIIFSRTKLDHK